MRRPLDLVVATQRGTDLARSLDALGAGTMDFPVERAVFAIRRPHPAIAAHALVVDCSHENMLDSGGPAVTVGFSLSWHIRALLGSDVMPTGARWRNIPIVLVVQERQVAAMINSAPELRFLSAVALQQGAGAVYAHIDEVAMDGARRQLEAMQQAGVPIVRVRSRYIRGTVPFALRSMLVENEFYVPERDCLLRSVARQWTAVDVILADHGVAEEDLQLGQDLVRLRHPEPEFHRLCNQAGFVYGAAACEIYPEPRLMTGQRTHIRPDTVVARIGSQPSTVYEFKRPGAPIVEHMRAHSRPSEYWIEARAQTYTARDYLTSPAYRSQLDRVFGRTFDDASLDATIVLGDTTREQRDALARERARLSDITVLGCNEFLEKAHERLDAAVPYEVELRWGSVYEDDGSSVNQLRSRRASRGDRYR